MRIGICHLFFLLVCSLFEKQEPNRKRAKTNRIIVRILSCFFFEFDCVVIYPNVYSFICRYSKFMNRPFSANLQCQSRIYVCICNENCCLPSVLVLSVVQFFFFFSKEKLREKASITYIINGCHSYHFYGICIPYNIYLFSMPILKNSHQSSLKINNE